MAVRRPSPAVRKVLPTPRPRRGSPAASRPTPRSTRAFPPRTTPPRRRPTPPPPLPRRADPMLIPRRVKHRKQHHPGRSGAAKGGTKVVFGEYGIQALEPGDVTNPQIEAARIAKTRHTNRGGKDWVKNYPARPPPKKP